MRPAKPQSRFMKIVCVPVRFLGKARDFYVKSMTGCGQRVTYGHGVGAYGNLPRSFSAASSRSNDEPDDYGELIRAASLRTFGHRSELYAFLRQLKDHQTSLAAAAGGGSKVQLPKSCSVGMGGFMGRIEEEVPCDFEEDGDGRGGNKGDGGVKTELYTRSKSYAVAERNVVF